MESSRTSPFLKKGRWPRRLPAGTVTPLAFAFPAQQNLNDALRAVSFIVVDTVPVRPALLCAG
jgi:hypothetical protein